MKKWWIDDLNQMICAPLDHPILGLDKLPWPDSDKVYIAIDIKEYEKLEKENERLIKLLTSHNINYMNWNKE